MVNGLASVTTTGMVTGTVAGRDTVVYTVTNSCGTGIATHPVQILQLPPTGVVLGPDSVCVASQITVYDTVSGGLWILANNHASIDSSGTITGLQGGADTVYYVQTNYCGSDIANKAIVVNPLPDAGTITGADCLCIATTATLNDTIGGGNWQSASGGITVAGNVVTGVAAGMNTVWYIVNNSCGADTARLTVWVYGHPDAGSLIATKTSLCIGDTSLISDTTASINTGGWISIGGNVSLTPLPGNTCLLTGQTPGLDTIYFIVSNNCGADTASTALLVSSPPNMPTLTGATIVCVDRQTDTLTATPPGGVWTVTNANASLTGNILTAVTPGQDTIIYTLANTCGDSSAAIVVTIPNAWTCDSINLAPTLSIEPDLELYPNPAGDILELAHCTRYSQAAIYNSPGQCLTAPILLLSDHVTIDVSKLPPGIYFVRAKTKTGLTHVRRFIKG